MVDSVDHLGPWLIFKLKDDYYAINSDFIVTIMTLPKNIVAVPNYMDSCRGIFELRGDIIPLFSLRALFHMQAIEDEYQEFSAMLEQRKQDHIHWVEELKSSVAEDRPFTLTTDHHQCAFGQWYDHFVTDLPSLRFIMNKIDEPHRELHASAKAFEACNKDHDHCKREMCLGTIFKKLSEEYVPKILGLIDEMKIAFRDHYKEMTVVVEVDGNKFGVIVDDIVSVERMDEQFEYHNLDSMSFSQFIEGIRKRQNSEQQVLAIHTELLANHLMGQTM